MALVDLGLVPSLLQGISQQPQGLRLPGQATDVHNGWGTAVEGLSKRPPTRHVAKVTTHTLPPNVTPAFHAINRDPTERYLLALYPDRIKAYKTDGTEVHVEMTASTDYLNTRTPNPIAEPETFDVAAGTGWTEVNPLLTVLPSAGVETGPLGWGTGWELATEGGGGAPGYYSFVGSATPYLTNRWRGGVGAITVFSCYFKFSSSSPAAEEVELVLRDATGTVSTWTGTFTFTAGVLAANGTAVTGTAALGELDTWVEDIGQGWYRASMQVTAASDYNGSSMDCRVGVKSTHGTLDLPVEAWGAHLEYEADNRFADLKAAPYTVNEEERLKVLTVQDYTFITNNSVAVAKTAAVSASPANTGEAYVFCKSASLMTTYSTRIKQGANDETYYVGTHTGAATNSGHTEGICAGGSNTTTAAKCTTSGGVYVGAGTDDNRTFPDPTSVIWRFDQYISAGDLPAGAGTGLILPTTTVAGAVLELTDITAFDLVHATGDRSQDSIVSFMNASTAHKVDTISDLPLTMRDGVRVTIGQGSDDEVDDITVEFVADEADDFGPGHWVESTPYDQANTLDATTMPHALVRKQDNASGTVTGTPYEIYFEFETVDWSDREVGDDNSNPDPAFVGATVNNLTFFRNRLGFISGQDVTFSGTGDYFNFWRTSTQTLLDSDPVGTQVTHTSVSTLYNSLPFDRNLLLNSDRGQFLLTGEPVLSPTTISTKSLYSFESLTVPAMVEAGKTVQWFSKQGEFTAVRELTPSQRASDVYDVDTVSEQIPKLISGKVVQAVASTLSDTLVALADGDRSQLYAYTWFYRQDTKLQSAWVRWSFNNTPLMAETANILGIQFIEDELYILIERDDGIYIEAMRLSEGLEDSTEMAFVARLDRRIHEGYPGLSLVYNAGPDTTTISGLPWDIPASTATLALMGTNLNPATIYPYSSRVVTTPGSHTVTFEGDLTGLEKFYLGFTYDFEYEFSEYWKPQPTSRGAIAPSLREPEQIISGALLVEDSGYFDVQVQPKNGALVTQEFRGTIEGIHTRVSQGSDTSYDVPFSTGIYRFAVGAKNNEVKVRVVSDSPLPVRMVNAEWETEHERRGSSSRS